MNDPAAPHGNADPKTGSASNLLTITGIVGAILIFVIIVFVAYLPNQGDNIDESIIADRKDRAATARATQTEMTTTYSMMDPTTGQVRIPVEAAMAMTVEEMNASEDNQMTFPSMEAEPESAPAP